MLHPRVAVLRRPSGAVQLGWDPERAVVLDPPGMSAEAVVAFLRLLDGLRSHPQIVWQAGQFGIEAGDAVLLLAEIDAAGLLLRPRPRPEVTAVHVHGRGPLSDAITAGVRRLGLRPTRSRDYDTAVAGRATDVVVLADTLVPDPRLVNNLVLHRIPHLQLRIRDGRGVVGPLVLPGATSCLRCADLTRRDLDADWPHLAAQLLDRVGHASAATITATAALALRDLEAIIGGVAERPPQTLDTTLELDPDSHRVDRRRWTMHPACGCRALATAEPR
jgi:bacteriocin biosynthesis cyclodehydratase domain-containing protein